MKSLPIGILDSGVGGLSIWKEIIRELPNESTIYLADSINCPYGEKSEEEIFFLGKRLVRFLVEKKVKLVVVACNTITVFCIDKLRRAFPDIPIIGTVPAIKPAAKYSKNKKIGILSTTATSKSVYQKSLIEKFAKDCKVISIGTGELVPFIEKGDIESKEVKKVLKKILKEFVFNKIDTIALGCSHFPFLRQLIQEIVGDKVKILDSSSAIARQVKRVLTDNNNLSNSNSQSYRFYTTGSGDQFKTVAKKLVRDKVGYLIKSVHSVSL